MIYLDNNATTPLRPSVKEAMASSLDVFGNPSSVHGAGRDARMALDKARRQVANLFNTRSEQVVFTSGGTEADVMALRGFMKTAHHKRLITSTTEHAAVYNTAETLASEGVDVTYLPVDSNGIVDLKFLEHELSQANVGLVSMMYVNNETGVIQPVEEVVKFCKKHNVSLHLDAVQAVAKIEIDFAKLGADMLSVAFHKFGGPKGVGALLMRNELDMEALIQGGGQERNRRGGTENVLAIIGAGQAAEEAQGSFSDIERLKKLSAKLEAGLKELDENIIVTGESVNRTGLTTCFINEKVEGETAILSLDMAGIAVSQGSACSSGRVEPSRVLLEMGYNENQAKCAIRVGFAWHNTEKDVDAFLKAYGDILSRISK